jgi:hypothetical protein
MSKESAGMVVQINLVSFFFLSILIQGLSEQPGKLLVSKEGAGMYCQLLG